MSDAQYSVAPRDHFSSVVPKWSHFGPPLRPSPDDTAIVQRVIANIGPAAHAVVLGLTPEIIACNWPDDITLSAVDHSPAMIQALWPPAKGPSNSRVIPANWCAMPIPSGTIDLVAGDGCYILQTHPEGFKALTREVRRVLRHAGRFVIRVFLRPDRSESVTEISHAFTSGKIGSVHALKLRLLAALHGASGEGSCLDDVWQTWKSMPSLPATLAGSRGWTTEEIVGIESYRGMEARYFLPTLVEFRESLSPELSEVECAWGRHELADRCPTLVFTRGVS